MDTDDSILLRRWVSEHDADAFVQVAMHHAKMVYCVALRILGNTHDAEEVAQECFETLASLKKPPHCNLSGWLYQVAANQAKNRIRSEQRRQNREERYVAENIAQLPPVSGVSWEEVYRQVDESVLTLPDINREPLIAHFFEQETHETIAQRLGVTRRTVGYRIQQGIEMAREELKKRGIPVTVVALGAWFEAQATAISAPSAQLAAQLARIGLSGVGRTTVTSGPVSLLGRIGQMGRMGILENAGWVARGILAAALIGTALFLNAEPPRSIETVPVASPFIKTVQVETQTKVNPPKAVDAVSAPSESPVSSEKEDPLASLWGWWLVEFKEVNESTSIRCKVKIQQEGNNIVFVSDSDFRLSGTNQGLFIDVVMVIDSTPDQTELTGTYTPYTDSFILNGSYRSQERRSHWVVAFLRMTKAAIVCEERKKELEAINSALDEYKKNSKGAYPERLEEVARYFKGDVALLTSSPEREITYQPKGLTKPEVCFSEDMLQCDSEEQYADQIVAVEARLSRSGVYQYLFQPALMSIKYSEYAQRISTRGRICESIRVECDDTQFTEIENEERYYTCKANLKDFNLITFANNHHDYLPGGWATLYPEYLSDLTTLSCPCRPIGDESYELLFPAVTRTAFCQDLYKKVMEEDVETYIAQSAVPMVIERGIHTIKGKQGRNVLFFDNHVDFVQLSDLPQRVDRFVQANR